MNLENKIDLIFSEILQEGISTHALPYKFNEFTPTVSAEAMKEHYEKHYKGYIKKTRLLTTNKDLKKVVQTSNGTLFNNAAQAWNHEFYWNSMSPKQTEPDENTLEKIVKSFGNIKKFKDQWVEKSIELFGNGWCWLIKEDKLKIITTSNAGTPITKGQKPLLVMDLWEHAYYLDYKSNREEFVRKWVNNLLNWNFVKKNLR